jgi:alpha-tubulin suppressor-like RCC1 family protein
MAYLITSADEGNFFYYSLEKKVENSNRLYEIRNTARKIMGHPTLTSVPVTRTVKENSVGRLHSLYWDGQEHLYSWGCRIWP